MKYIALLVVLLTFATGCANEDQLSKQRNNDGSYTLDTVFINGMECIILKNESSNGYTITTFDCNWPNS